MQSSNQNKTQIHPEIEDAENLGIGKDEDNDSQKVGDVNSRELNVGELEDGLVGAIDVSPLQADGIGAQDVTGELHTDADGCDQVDQ
jgi:hypothetical protein